MARENALKSIVIILIYFVTISLIYTLIAGVQGIFGFDSGSITLDTDSYVVNTCVEPRFSPGGDNELNTANVACNRLGLETYDGCERVEGCTWYNATGWLAPDPYCANNINHTYYGITESTYLDGSNLVYSSSNDDVNVCTELTHTEDSCQLIGCTWVGSEGSLENIQNIDVEGYISITGGVSGLKSFWSTLSQAFTLRLDFTTDNTTLNLGLKFAMLLLPLIILIGSVIVFILG